MSDLQIKWKSKGIKEILRGDQMLEGLEVIAQNIASAAGEGHRVETEIGPNRARAAVITDTSEAVRAEVREQNLTHAIDAGRVS